MGLYDQSIAVFIFFTVLCTISVGLRIFVRTRLCKGAFGWDDIALIITWVCMSTRRGSLREVYADIEAER